MARPIPRVPPVTTAVLPERGSKTDCMSDALLSIRFHYKIEIGMSPAAPTSPLRQILETRMAQLSEEVEELFAQARERGRRESADQLNQAVRRIRQCPDLSELAAMLVDAAAAFASGAALFRIEGQSAKGD